MTANYTPTEMMTIAAARALKNDDVALSASARRAPPAISRASRTRPTSC